SDFPAASAAGEELIAAIGFESRHARSGWHIEPLEQLSRLGIDASHIALITIPGAMPELAIHPGDPGDEAVGLDGAQDLAGLGISGIQRVSCRKPHMTAIIGDAIYLLDTRKGSIFAENFGG